MRIATFVKINMKYVIFNYTVKDKDRQVWPLACIMAQMKRGQILSSPSWDRS